VSRRSRKATQPTARYAAIIAILVTAAAVTVLIACPPAAPRESVQTPSTRQPTVSSQPVQPSAQTTPETASPGSQPTQTTGPTVRPSLSGSAAPEHPQVEEKGRLAVIIDDAGYSLEELRAVLALPGPYAVAVLPNLPHSTEAARMVVAAGKTLLLHCPMEPVGGENPGPGALYTGQSPEQIEELLDEAFASVPGAVGMNNHMGSKATADEALMRTVLSYLKRKGLIWVDSRTTAETVGPRIARQLAVPYVERDVFIDVSTSTEDITAAFEKGVAEAKSRGSAVLIGHVQNKGVVAILRAMNGSLSGQGVEMASLADVSPRGTSAR
jgi:uncharacterized protein